MDRQLKQAAFVASRFDTNAATAATYGRITDAPARTTGPVGRAGTDRLVCHPTPRALPDAGFSVGTRQTLCCWKSASVASR